MINLNELQLENVEFSDCKLNSMKLETKTQKLEIEMAEIYLIKEKEFLENISFIGDKYDSVLITWYNSNTEERGESDLLEPINEILDVQINNNIIKFCGFGVDSGNWIEISFKNLIYHFKLNSL